ncbi:glycerol kinase GlpK [Granulicella sp. 5B5]|uniref:glycerol kinase GlpK n=1 Tax=Granulicella sp. 5B5 TaxID=1617967 RepID=UPI0015F5764E|nr:glycerol kinase GlpK [Granulicella sp. 5B5]QMV18881.1 glycerol kinase GlpK [Granulicella sp. 5B5]
MSVILALDQGTSSSRAVLIGTDARILATAQRELPQIYPQPGWVEQDPETIWSTQLAAVRDVMAQLQLTAADIAAVGITNQRETTILWDRSTGHPIHNALVWQDRRSAPLCDQLRAAGHEPLFQQKTGLIFDAYFSASKIRWLLDNVEGARAKAESGQLAFGTVDSWLIWKLTRNQKGGPTHVTDVTNASRTLLFNIHTLDWDDELLRIFDIPRSLMPTVVPSSGPCATLGDLLPNVPICGIAGDQQAALFGQMCLHPGMVKNTYGTGCFMLMQTGEKPVASTNRLLTTIAWQLAGQPAQYALEGSVFIAGAAVQWLRDGLGIIGSSAEVEPLAASVPDSGGVYFVPSLSGLGAPYWDADARGLILGLTRGTTRAHIARATLEGIALQVTDILTAMQADSAIAIPELRVDGGASANHLLMQMQADLLGTPVVRSGTPESTVMGAAYLAGLGSGFWSSVSELESLWTRGESFTPAISTTERTTQLTRWKEAVSRSQHWATEPTN